ncbi:MAG: DUF6174 domain-containing protein [Roseiflexaceae bacterium]|nr:DUF6174 domain-containing protein [Roseiflexaceae bacterium]
MQKFIIIIALAAIVLIGCGRTTPYEPLPVPIATQAPTATDIPTQLPIQPTVKPTNGPTAIPPTDVTAAAELVARLRAAEQHWQASQIASYRITVLEIHSIWSAQRMTFMVTDGHVVDQQSMCIPAPSQGKTCAIQPVEQSNYLVPALFAQARALIEHQRPENIQLEFDPTHGYPISIGYDDPQILDEDYGLRIEKFEQLPGRPTNELGQTIQLHVGEQAQSGDLTVKLVRIAEDSRCPASVNCAWSGQVVVELLVTAPNQNPESVTLKLMGTGMKLEQPTLVAQSWHVQMTSVTPYPRTPDPIPTKEYWVTVRIGK